MALRKRKKAKTTLTFAVTIPQFEGMSIKDTRLALIDAIQASRNSFTDKIGTPVEIKAYLLNKETTYA